jgi:hypothetical protein
MRHQIVIALLVVVGAACKDSAEEGRREAQRIAAIEAQRERDSGKVAPKIRAPVQSQRKIDCARLIDMAGFGEALGEKDPISVRDVSKTNLDASASCSLVRGGRMVSAKEQQAMIKRTGRLGVLPGDELCNVTAYCNLIEDEEHVKARCAELKRQNDDSMGSYACVRIVPHGANDVKSFRFFDAETKCVMEVRGGPSMTDNDFITTCAKAARDLIGPEQIAEAPASSTEPSAGSGSAEAGAAAAGSAAAPQ